MVSGIKPFATSISFITFLFFEFRPVGIIRSYLFYLILQCVALKVVFLTMQITHRTNCILGCFCCYDKLHKISSLRQHMYNIFCRTCRSEIQVGLTGFSGEGLTGPSPVPVSQILIVNLWKEFAFMFIQADRVLFLDCKEIALWAFFLIVVVSTYISELAMVL